MNQILVYFVKLRNLNHFEKLSNTHPNSRSFYKTRLSIRLKHFF